MAPRDDEKAMDGLLRRSLARGRGAGDACPEPDILAAYFERSLNHDEMASYEIHFSQCSRCREQLAAMLRAEGLAENPSVREVTIAAAAPPRTRSAIREAARAPQPEKRAHIRVLDWRWLAPVAAAVVVVVFLYLRDTFRVASLRAPTAEVAMSRRDEAAQPGVADSESHVNQLVVPPVAPPAAQPKLPTVAPNGPAKPSPKLSEKKSELANAARAEYQMRDDLRKRVQASTATSLEKYPSVETEASSSPSTASRDSSTARKEPVAATAAPPPSPAKAGGKEAEAGAGGAPEQLGTTSAMMSNKAQNPKVAGALAADSLNPTSQLMEAKSAVAVIQTPDASVQYRIAGVGTVERSQDGGVTWQGQILNSNAEILAGAAPSENVCWLVGRRGTILLTVDGTKWDKISPPAKVDFVGVAAADASSATVTSAAGRRYATADGGSTWKLLK
ncbi:MAG: WD40/YVTN/BNR-like repeat-containing protein [Candidatus Acidiferrales bacterium]